MNNKIKQVRAVPDGYYTGLINDMHKDYETFQTKGKFRQMEYLDSSIHQRSQLIDRFEERKLDKYQAPFTLNSLSIQCTLPSDYHQLENLSPISYLIKYAKPSSNRQQIIRKIHRDKILDIDDAKDILFEYFNQYKTHEDINELFHFLDINSTDKFHLNEIVIICCYAERYFLHKLSKYENVIFKRPLQEIIDFEFLKRKLNGLVLTDSLQRLFKTLEEPEKY